MTMSWCAVQKSPSRGISQSCAKAMVVPIDTRPRAAHLPHLPERGGDALEGVLQALGHGVALGRQFQRAVQPEKQRPADLLLQRLHLLGNRTRRDVQFLRRAREAQMPRRRLEGGQRVERGQAVVAADHEQIIARSVD